MVTKTTTTTRQKRIWAFAFGRNNKNTYELVHSRASSVELCKFKRRTIEMKCKHFNRFVYESFRPHIRTRLSLPHGNLVTQSMACKGYSAVVSMSTSSSSSSSIHLYTLSAALPRRPSRQINPKRKWFAFFVFPKPEPACTCVLWHDVPLNMPAAQKYTAKHWRKHFVLYTKAISAVWECIGCTRFAVIYFLSILSVSLFLSSTTK